MSECCRRSNITKAGRMGDIPSPPGLSSMTLVMIISYPSLKPRCILSPTRCKHFIGFLPTWHPPYPLICSTVSHWDWSLTFYSVVIVSYPATSLLRFIYNHQLKLLQALWHQLPSITCSFNHFGHMSVTADSLLIRDALTTWLIEADITRMKASVRFELLLNISSSVIDMCTLEGRCIIG